MYINRKDRRESEGRGRDLNGRREWKTISFPNPHWKQTEEIHIETIVKIYMSEFYQYIHLVEKVCTFSTI